MLTLHIVERLLEFQDLSASYKLFDKARLATAVLPFETFRLMRLYIVASHCSFT